MLDLGGSSCEYALASEAKMRGGRPEIWAWRLKGLFASERSEIEECKDETDGDEGGEVSEVDRDGVVGDRGGERPYGVRKKILDDEVARMR
jgi:hypothetical protein